MGKKPCPAGKYCDAQGNYKKALSIMQRNTNRILRAGKFQEKQEKQNEQLWAELAALRERVAELEIAAPASSRDLQGIIISSEIAAKIVGVSIPRFRQLCKRKHNPCPSIKITNSFHAYIKEEVEAWNKTRFLKRYRADNE